MRKKKILNEVIYILRSILVCVVFVLITIGAVVLLREPLLEKETELQMQMETVKQQVITQEMLEIMEIPREVFQLIGMVELQQVDAAYEIYLILMLVWNVVIFGMIISHSVHIWEVDEDAKNYLFYYGQVTTRVGYLLGRVVNGISSAFILWSIYICAMLTGIKVVSDQFGILASQVNGLIVESWKMGFSVAVLMVSVGFLYAMIRNRRMSGGIYAQYVVMFLFSVGNMFKITQMVAYYQRVNQMNSLLMEHITDVLTKLQVLCPFACLNPFSILNDMVIENVVWLYLAFAMLGGAFVGFVFVRKEWE